MKKHKWGLVATGWIAEQFVTGLKLLENAELYAVASRNLESAQAFAKAHGFQKAYGSYEELARDKDVDIVYISTPNNYHLENTLMFIEAGHNILCEKPLGLNAREVQTIVDAAKAGGHFFMEAMWTRFFPAVRKAMEWISEGRIGKVRLFKGEFCVDSGSHFDEWRWQLNSGGGSLLDVGIYPVAFAAMVFGRQPDEVTGIAHKAPTGVDASAGMVFGYDNDQMAVMACSLDTPLEGTAWIMGEKGRIRLDNFYHPDKAILYDLNDIFGHNEVELDRFEQPHEHIGMKYEAMGVMDCLDKGLTECPLMPLSDSVGIAQTMDRLRALWGIEYPADKVK